MQMIVRRTLPVFALAALLLTHGVASADPVREAFARLEGFAARVEGHSNELFYFIRDTQRNAPGAGEILTSLSAMHREARQLKENASRCGNPAALQQQVDCLNRTFQGVTQRAFQLRAGGDIDDFGRPLGDTRNIGRLIDCLSDELNQLQCQFDQLSDRAFFGAAGQPQPFQTQPYQSQPYPTNAYFGPAHGANYGLAPGGSFHHIVQPGCGPHHGGFAYGSGYAPGAAGLYLGGRRFSPQPGR